MYPADTLALSGLARTHQDRGETDKPEENYLRALRFKPGDPKISSSLAQLYSESGQDGKAMDLYTRILERDPSHAGAEYGLASCTPAGRTRCGREHSCAPCTWSRKRRGAQLPGVIS